jgi:hypothetical protein
MKKAICYMIGHRYPSDDHEPAWCERCGASMWEYDCTLPEWVKSLVARIICRSKGHDLEDVSTIGPDSGSMDVECRRCGAYWHTQLY